MSRHACRVALRCGLLVFSILLAPAALGLDRAFDSAGVRIRYVEAGPADGEAVVLIHGFSGNVELTWIESGILDLFADPGNDAYRALALDCRGHGRSDKPADPDAYGTEMVDDVLRLLDHLRIERAHLVGYAMGGRIALKLAATHPDRARSVILIGDGGARPDEDHRLWDGVVAALGEGDGIRPLVLHVFPDATEEQIDQANASTLARNDPKVLAAVARGYRELSVPDAALRAVLAPVVAVIGSNDPFLDDVATLEERLPGLRVVVVNDADHVDVLARPELRAVLKKTLSAR